MTPLPLQRVPMLDVTTVQTPHPRVRLRVPQWPLLHAVPAKRYRWSPSTPPFDEPAHAPVVQDQGHPPCVATGALTAEWLPTPPRHRQRSHRSASDLRANCAKVPP